MKIVIDSFSGCKANTADVGFIGLEYCKWHLKAVAFK